MQFALIALHCTRDDELRHEHMVTSRQMYP